MKTIEEIEDYLRSNKVSGMIAVRIVTLAKNFATLDSFFSARRADIEKMYNRLTPDNKHGIGKKFWQAFDMALGFYRGQSVKIENMSRDQEKTLPAANDNLPSRMHTYDELKAIVDMMELCGIESINFLEISGFLENVKFRQKKEAHASTGDDADTGASNAKK
jgi:hypothetical protein